MPAKPSPHDLLVGLLLVQSLLEKRSEAFFQPHGLTGAQFNILNLLAVHEGRMDQLALVDLLLVGKSSISIVLNRMVRDDLIRREDHPKDRRQVVLVLTAKGKRLWQKILPGYETGVKELFAHLPSARREVFLRDLESLHHALLESSGASPAEADIHWRSYLTEFPQ